MKVTINFDKLMCQPDGTPLELMNLAEQLSNGLSGQFKSSNPRKVWGWCKELQKSKSLELDPTDVDLLIQEINSAEGFNVMFRGQLLDEISDQTKEAKK